MFLMSVLLYMLFLMPQNMVPFYILSPSGETLPLPTPKADSCITSSARPSLKRQCCLLYASSTYLTNLLNSWSTHLSPSLAYAHLEARLLIQHYVLSAKHVWQYICLLNDYMSQFLTWCQAPKSDSSDKENDKLLKTAKYLRTSKAHSLNEDRVYYGALLQP